MSEVYCGCRLIRLVTDEEESPGDFQVRCPRCKDVVSPLEGSQETVRVELKMTVALLASVDAARKGVPRSAFIRAALQEKMKK